MSEKHIPALDGIRGLAVLIVVIFHAGSGAHSSNALIRIFGNAIQIGWIGVTLFFVLSGFLITGILWDSRGADHWYRNFYMRRILRIFPLYYLALVIILAASLILGNLAQTASHIWVFALYLQNVPRLSRIGAGFSSPFNLYHFWSLAVEEQFYLIWPFLLRFRSISQMKYLCLGTFLFSLLFRVIGLWSVRSATPFADFLFCHAGELALGAWIAMISREPAWHRMAPTLARLSPLFLLAFLATCMPTRSFRSTDNWVFTLGLSFITLFWGSVVIAALQPGVISHMMQARWLRRLGGISYGVYVYHVLLGTIFFHLAIRLAHPGNRNQIFGLSFVITVVGSVATAWVSFKFFENPILQLRKRYQARSVQTLTT